jgi:hypothetical protein
VGWGCWVRRWWGKGVRLVFEKLFLQVAAALLQRGRKNSEGRSSSSRQIHVGGVGLGKVMGQAHRAMAGDVMTSTKHFQVCHCLNFL